MVSANNDTYTMVNS